MLSNGKRPRFADDWPWLSRVARDLLANRVAQSPTAIEKGQMTRAEADDAQRIAAAIVSDILALIGHAPIEETPEARTEKRADLSKACVRAEARATAAPGSQQKRDYADCLKAIAWLYEPWMPGGQMSRIAFLSAANFELKRPERRLQAAA